MKNLLRISASGGGKWPGLLQVHAAVLFFGFAGLFPRWLPLSPWVLVFGRTVFAALTLGLLLLAGKRRLRPGANQSSWLLLLAGILLAVHWYAFFKAIQLSTVAVGLFSFASFPVFVLLLEPLLFREAWRWRHLFFVFLVLLGIYLIANPGTISGTYVPGLLWGLFSGFTFALLSLGNRALRLTLSGVLIAFWQNSVAALFLLPFAFKHCLHLDAIQLLLLGMLGVGCTALAHTLFINGLRFVAVRTASVIALLEPVYGVLLALFIFGEIPALRTVAGGALICVAALAATVLPD